MRALPSSWNCSVVVGMLVFRGAVSGVRHLSFASSVVFDVACYASDFRGPAGPLPQVHPDKWYPSVGTWTSREGCLGKLGWMSGGVLNAIIRAKGPCTLFCKTRGCNKLDDPPEPFLNESALRRYDATRIGSARTGLVIEWV